MSAWDTVALPQVWITAAIVAGLFARSIKRREWPSMDDFVELMAYGAAVWGAGAAFAETLRKYDHVDVAFAQMAGAVLLAFAACRGMWKTFTRADDTETKPTPVSKPPTGP